MTFRRRIVLYASSMLGPLLAATGAMLVFVVGLLVLFFIISRSEVLFVVEAETSRFEYTVMNPERIEIPVRNVRVITRNKQVVRQTAAPEDQPTNCYSGVLLPGLDTNVVFQLDQGLQQIELLPKDGKDQSGIARLTQGDARYAVEGTKVDKTSSLLAPDHEPSGGFVVLSGLTTLTQDPACSDGDVPFALPEEPVVIDGRGSIGHGSLSSSPDPLNPVMPALGLEYIAGDIDILMRESICFERLHGEPCKNIFKLASDPIAIPTSSALLGKLSDDQLAPMIGQAYFEGGHYVVQASMNAHKLVIAQPSPTNWSSSEQSFLGVSWLDRLLVEPLLIFGFSAFFSLLGITLGVLQIEVHDEQEDVEKNL